MVKYFLNFLAIFHSNSKAIPSQSSVLRGCTRKHLIKFLWRFVGCLFDVPLNENIIKEIVECLFRQILRVVTETLCVEMFGDVTGNQNMFSGYSRGIFYKFIYFVKKIHELLKENWDLFNKRQNYP